MIRIIRGHNRLNGMRFSAVEFGFVGLVAVVLAGYFLLFGAATRSTDSVSVNGAGLEAP